MIIYREKETVNTIVLCDIIKNTGKKEKENLRDLQ